MPKFSVLSRVDAYVDYPTVVEAEDAQGAADLVHEAPASPGRRAASWSLTRGGHRLDAEGEEIESTARGKG